MGRSRLQRTNGCEPPTPHSRIHHHGRGTGDKFPAQKISPECLPGFSPESSPVAASDSVSPLRRDPPADKTTSCSSAAVAPSLLQPARDYLENMHNAPINFNPNVTGKLNLTENKFFLSFEKEAIEDKRKIEIDETFAKLY